MKKILLIALVAGLSISLGYFVAKYLDNKGKTAKKDESKGEEKSPLKSPANPKGKPDLVSPGEEVTKPKDLVMVGDIKVEANTVQNRS